jgi:hypothetical protein
MKKMILQILGALFTALGVFFIAGMISALPVCLLWNLLLPNLFHFPAINIWQAWGLCVLFSILFGSSKTSTNKT